MKRVTSLAILLILHNVQAASINTLVTGTNATWIQSRHICSHSMDNTRFDCTLTIIGEQWLLTTSSCLNNIKRHNAIRCGSVSPTTGGKLYTVDLKQSQGNSPPWSPNLPPEYYEDYHDFALVKIVEKFNFRLDETVADVKVPLLDDRVATGQEVRVTGWGRPAKMTPPWLDRARTVLQTTKECQSGNEDPVTMCTRTNEQGDGACGRTDLGAPLIWGNLLDGYTLVGIVRYKDATNNCDQERDATYVRVSRFTDWIKQISGISSRPPID